MCFSFFYFHFFYASLVSCHEARDSFIFLLIYLEALWLIIPKWNKKNAFELERGNDIYTSLKRNEWLIYSSRRFRRPVSWNFVTYQRACVFALRINDCRKVSTFFHPCNRGTRTRGTMHCDTRPKAIAHIDCIKINKYTSTRHACDPKKCGSKYIFLM